MRDYQFISPSIEGILSHSSLSYEGITRPLEVMKILDGPAFRGKSVRPSESEERVLEQYFQDIYAVFLKKLSVFVVGRENHPEEVIKLQALFQEMLKIKKLLAR